MSPHVKMSTRSTLHGACHYWDNSHVFMFLENVRMGHATAGTIRMSTHGPCHYWDNSHVFMFGKCPMGHAAAGTIYVSLRVENVNLQVTGTCVLLVRLPAYSWQLTPMLMKG